MSASTPGWAAGHDSRQVQEMGARPLAARARRAPRGPPRWHPAPHVGAAGPEHRERSTTCCTTGADGMAAARQADDNRDARQRRYRQRAERW